MDDESKPPFLGSRSPFRVGLRRTRARFLGALDPRERLGDLLNALERSRTLRLKCYAALMVAAGLMLAGIWAYPRWREDNALKRARQWLDANKLDRAAEAVELALTVAPERAETWRYAAQYARLAGHPGGAANYARHAAQLEPTDSALALDWATLALTAGRVDEAREALAQMAATERVGSAAAQRVAGEIARRQGDLSAARVRFERALRLDGPGAIDEVPLGVVLAAGPAGPDRRRGLALLAKWRGDPSLGLECLRALLEQAVATDDRPQMLQWADELRRHPASAQADRMNGLLAISLAAPSHFADALAAEEVRAARTPGDAAQLIGWLSGTAHGAEALLWAQTLPDGMSHRPPVIVAVADALRLAADWPGLEAWTRSGEWDKLDEVRRAYAALAARQLGDTARADELWRGLRATSRLNGGEALFLAGLLYSWGWKDEAVTLWGFAADRPTLALNALGALARHYQLQRDAEGQLRVFRRLHGLREQDAAITNNYVYLAALLGADDARTEENARRNCELYPSRLTYRSTYAFVLLRQGQPSKALALLQPVASQLEAEPGLAYTYGLVLSGNGRFREARSVLAKVDRAGLTISEEKLLDAALGRS